MIATSAGRIALPAAYWGARRAGVPFLYWSGIWSQLTTPAHLAAIPLVRRIERRADAVIAYGPHVARVRPLARRAQRPHRAAAGRRRLLVRAARTGRPHARGPARRRCSALFAGRDAPGKGVPELLAAWRASATRRAAAAGAGRAFAAAARAAATAGVLALGPVDAGELRNFYAAADVLDRAVGPHALLPRAVGAGGQRGDASGNPVIATDSVGAAAGGLVVDGEPRDSSSGRRHAPRWPRAIDGWRTTRRCAALGAAGRAAASGYDSSMRGRRLARAGERRTAARLTAAEVVR